MKRFAVISAMHTHKLM